MILYHGTTEHRARLILRDNCIKKDVERYFTEEYNGDGYSTQGYIYLTNEITFAVYFANCHKFVDKSTNIYVFKIDVPPQLIEPDYDELRYQSATDEEINSYGGPLKCSLLEYKACRVKTDINFDRFSVQYCVLPITDTIGNLLDNAGCNYKYVVTHYTKAQREFINNINWINL